MNVQTYCLIRLREAKRLNVAMDFLENFNQSLLVDFYDRAFKLCLGIDEAFYDNNSLLLFELL